jgi:hypothetical protein
MRNINFDIKKAISDARIYVYEVADELGISEPGFRLWLRKDLSDEKRARILEAIDKVKCKVYVGINTDAEQSGYRISGD